MFSPFKITPRVIAHLGEDLIKNENIALLELVKNSYDANASICSVIFTFDNQTDLKSIRIEDNGDGMSREIIENVWLVIGTDNKKKLVQTNVNNKRLPLGEKGIGRLGVHKLGHKITLFSKDQFNNEVRVRIDWSKLDLCNNVEDFEIEVDELEEPSGELCSPIGTTIIIESIKGDWNRRKLRSVFRDLTSLNSPFSEKSDSFEVRVTSNTNVFQGLPNLSEILNIGMYRAKCTIRGNSIVSFLYEFIPWSSLKRLSSRVVSDLPDKEKYLLRKVERFSENGRQLKSELEPLNIDNYSIGPITLDIVIFERDVSVFSYMNMEKTTLNEFLRENGGVRVYRDNMRVYDYGEKDNDWLGLDTKRIGHSGGSIGNSLVIGSVSINRSESVDLKEKTNREGFIEDDAYYAFVDAVKYALDLIVFQRNIDKATLLSSYKVSSKVTEPVVGEINELIEFLDNASIQDEDKRTIKDYLQRINLQYKNVRDTLIKSANAGLNLGTAVHEMEKKVAELKGLAVRGEVPKIIELSKQLEQIVAGYSVFLMNSSVAQGDLSSIVKIVLENNYFRFQAHQIKILSNYKSYSGKAKLSKAEAIASLTNLIDNAIFWVSNNNETDRMIYVALTDELAPYSSIVVYDNGPGFMLSPEQAIQPFVSRKPLGTGMGLGLHITNEIMNGMGGKLIVMDSNDLQIPPKVSEYTEVPTAVVLCFPKI